MYAFEVDKSIHDESLVKASMGRRGRGDNNSYVLVSIYVLIIHSLVHVLSCVSIVALAVSIAVKVGNTSSSSLPPACAAFFNETGTATTVLDNEGRAEGVMITSTSGLTEIELQCLENGIGLLNFFTNASKTIDDLDEMVDADNFVYFHPSFGQLDFEGFKRASAPACCGDVRATSLKAFSASLRVILYEEVLGVESALFGSVDCDARTGRLVSAISYPPLQQESANIEAAMLMHEIAAGNTPPRQMDTLEFHEDFVFVSRNGRARGARGVTRLRSFLESGGAGMVPQLYFRSAGSKASVILRYAPPGAAVSFVDVGFDGNRITSVAFAESGAGTAAMSTAHSWHDVFSTDSPDYSILDNLVTSDYTVHWDGTESSLEELKTLGKFTEEQRARSISLSQRKYFQLDDDRTAVYVLHSQRYERDDGTDADIVSILWRHDFASDDVTRIRSSTGYRTADISVMARTMAAFESVRLHIVDGSSNDVEFLDPFRGIELAEDCSVRAYWMTGPEPCLQFRQEVIEYGRRNVNEQRAELARKRQDTLGAQYEPINGGLSGWVLIGDGPFVNKNDRNEFRTASTAIKYSGDVQVAMHQGYWVHHGARRVPNFVDTPGGILETNVDLFYFTPSDPISSARLLNVYMYNLTNN